MITGIVDAEYEIVIPLPVQDAGGQYQTVETVLDTGFTEVLTLPPSLISTLALSWDSREFVTLANGVIAEVDIYNATVVWDGTALPIQVQANDAHPLLGMTLLIGYELRVRFEVGGSVEIEAIP